MNTIRLERLRNQRGFSLAELLVACAMVGVVLAGVFVALQQGQNAFLYGTGKVEVQQNARVAVDRMVRELRLGSTITAANATSIAFSYIEDNAGAPQTFTVTYSLAGTNLQRNQTAPVAANETLIGGVNALALVYYDNNNAVTATVANIRVVDIRLITQPQATGLGSYNLANQRATFEDRVRLRNL
jgi:prepilin-type N-terminal cleavage/methylation domain-containing protein